MNLIPRAVFLLPGFLAAPWILALEAKPGEPSSVAAEDRPSWVRSDGSVCLIASDGLEALIDRWNALFRNAHPDTAIRVTRGARWAGLGPITAGIAPIALMDRDPWPLEARPFVQSHGYSPTAVVLGRRGCMGCAGACPPAVWVNSANSIPGLTLGQVAQIFTTGGPGGDVADWGQAGATGDLRSRRIHPCGLRDDGTWATGLRHLWLGGRPFTASYEPRPDPQAALESVAQDPCGIALLGSFIPGALPASVRVLPLASVAGAGYSGASAEDVRSGRYPLSPFIRAWVDRAPGGGWNRWIRDYLSVALSPAGQKALADANDGLFPLTPREAEAELQKLQ